MFPFPQCTAKWVQLTVHSGGLGCGTAASDECPQLSPTVWSLHTEPSLPAPGTNLNISIQTDEKMFNSDDD